MAMRTTTLRDLVASADPEALSRKDIAYEFSNGRKFFVYPTDGIYSTVEEEEEEVIVEDEDTLVGGEGG